jgi:hypothetical protein
MIKYDAIKNFVVTTLGCTCPEEVFKTISLEDDRLSIANVPITYKIVIGNRLLIYFVIARHLTNPEEQLRALVDAAKKERDGKKYNRSRIVLSADDVNTVDPQLRFLFEKIKGTDEKVHLHLVSENAIPQFKA